MVHQVWLEGMDAFRRPRGDVSFTPTNGTATNPDRRRKVPAMDQGVDRGAGEPGQLGDRAKTKELHAVLHGFNPNGRNEEQLGLNETFEKLAKFNEEGFPVLDHVYDMFLDHTGFFPTP